MEITLESVQKNQELYNQNIQKLMQQRAELMEKVKQIRESKRNLNDKLEVAKLDFEEAKLIQEINNITETFKGNKLTLEQLGLQRDILEMKIDKQAYSDGIVANREEKETLSKEQEVIYCENEIYKCEKAIELYTLMGDEENLSKWQKLLNSAKEDLQFAKQEAKKESKVDSKQEDKSSNKITEEKNEQTKESQYQGYTREEENSIKELQEQVLKNYSGKEIGKRTIEEQFENETGRRTIITNGELTNEDGEYTFSEISQGIGIDLENQRKEMVVNNKITGEKEQYVYEKDKEGRETYFRIADGKITCKITKTSRGTTMDYYDKGQITDSYEYDEKGMALIGMEGIDHIDENYVEYYFDSQVPYFEAEDRKLTSQPKEVSVLESAVQATEEITKSSAINQEAQNIKNIQKEKIQTQNIGKDR